MLKSTICQLSLIFLLCLARLSTVNGQEEDDVYTIGVGIADVTGPVAEVRDQFEHCFQLENFFA